MARSMPRGCVAVRVCGGVDSSQAVRECLGVDSSSLSSLTGSAFFCHQLPEYMNKKTGKNQITKIRNEKIG